MHILAMTLLALVLSTCQMGGLEPLGPRAEQSRQTPTGVVLRTDQQTYQPGQQLRLSLQNQTQEPIGFNLCHSTLEQRRGTQWVTAPRQTDEVCTSHLEIINAGQSASHTFTLPAGLPSGEYRFRTDLEIMATGARGPYASNSFQVVQ